jgi:hypothetical protein
VFVICALPKSETVQMVRPFEKPHGRLARRPSVPSPLRHHLDGLDRPLVPSIRLRTGSELVKGSAPFPRLAAVQTFKVQGQTRVRNLHVLTILETSKYKLAPEIGDDPMFDSLSRRVKPTDKNFWR